jgi:ribose transport system ATP-binding protein
VQLLSIEHLSKVFPGQVALDDVSLNVQAGSTHALVGQNGSGKSTLIKVLAGYHQPTGELANATMFGGGDQADIALQLGDGRSAEAAGIRFVHQDLGLVDVVSSVENLALGGRYTTRLGRIDWKAERKRAQSELAALGFDDFDVSAPVITLTPSQKTAVALARALRGWENGARLLVLDEPTASLPGADVQRLFKAIRLLKSRGVSILYVSHHLEEVFEIADEVTILRNGRNVLTTSIDTLDRDKLIELMVGHKVVSRRATPGTPGDVLLEAVALTGGNLRAIDMQVRAGEVVGIAGINGSGREFLVPLVTGQVPSASGTVRVATAYLDNFSPSAGLAAGLAFVAADRVRQGNFAMLSVTANTTITRPQRNVRRGRLVHALDHAESEAWISNLGTKAASTKVPMATLSGGNQQKVLFARGLRLEPAVLVLDEPTRGVDVGAKEEIHSLVDQAAAQGSAVLVASTDSEELVRVAHRVLIMRDGAIVAELLGPDITVENIERAQLQQKVEQQ